MKYIVSTKGNRPATAKISTNKLKELNIPPGIWAKIHTDTNHAYYCTVWPIHNIPDDHVVLDPLIEIEVVGSANAEQELKESVDNIIPLPTTIPPAVMVSVTCHTVSRDSSSSFFRFDDATDRQKRMIVRHHLENKAIQKAARLNIRTTSAKETISISIISTYPENSPVMITTATDIKIVDDTLTDEAKDMHKLTKGIESVRLSSSASDGDLNRSTVSTFSADKDNHSNSSSLQKAYKALYEVIQFPFLYKDWISQLNIECPKGVLLYGPPGVGKTYLVTSLTKECHGKLFIIQGPELYGSFIGESEERLRKKFTEARDYALENQETPVILFIDEIDALTPKRDNAQSQENRMVAQLLTLMDGMQSRGKLIVIGATNRPNSIDPALRRPGRFDREIHMEPPHADDRAALIKAQFDTIPVDSSVDIESLSSMTTGFVAADINALGREAAMAAIQRTIHQPEQDVRVTMADFKSALAVVGPSMQRGFQVQVEKTRWEDVGGLDEVKKKLKQAVEWPLIYKESFKRLGLKPPRGILLYGPPGCSKTTLVKVIASSINVTFLSINGAQLYSPFVGDSEKIIRTTFQKARASAPSIIFLDETEAIVGKRNMGNGGSSGGDSVQERVLSTLLNEMDGVESATSVLVIGATNRPDMLDAALMRPGRFDQAIYVAPPDELARLNILSIHTKRMPLAADVDLADIAKRTNYYTGADLQNLCREAAMEALRQTQHLSVENSDRTMTVTMSDFNSSIATIPASLNEELVKMYSKNPHGSKEQ